MAILTFDGPVEMTCMHKWPTLIVKGHEAQNCMGKILGYFSLQLVFLFNSEKILSGKFYFDITL